MNTTTLTIGATVNDDESVTITANGLDVATITLRHELNGITVHTVGIEYRVAMKWKPMLEARPSFSSNPTINEVPENVVRALASLVGVELD